jgi:hypothetical protein
MRPSTYAGLALLVASGAALAQQPLTLPGRSQTTGQQAVDNAACYAYANQTTKVNMAREPQTAPKNNTLSSRTMVSPSPVAPPLPPTASGALAASAAVAASGASAVTVAGASGVHGAKAPGATGAIGASGAAVAASASGASATMAAGASGAHGASAAMPSSAALAASGASDAILSGDMKMPPLPPPEPPMVRYWRAYSDCMQNRGYFVR